jgi:DNA-binding beta-propeller fold protein YncE
MTAARSSVQADSSHCSSSVVYAVSSNTQTVLIYDVGRKVLGRCGSISGFASPQGIFVDQHANLWVAASIGKQVYEFAPGHSSPSKTLSDPHGQPMDVAVDETSGTVYVTDYVNDMDKTVVVEVYANGSTTPTGTLNDSNMRNASSVAVDRDGNVYATFMTPANTPQVDKWIGGTGSPQNLGLTGLVSAGPIKTTQSGALAVCDPYGFVCGEFLAGTTEFTNKFAKIVAHDGIGPDKGEFFAPQGLALDRDEHRAFVSGYSLGVFKYPGPDRKPLQLVKVHGGVQAGVAVSPAAAPGAPF